MASVDMKDAALKKHLYNQTHSSVQETLANVRKWQPNNLEFESCYYKEDERGNTCDCTKKLDSDMVRNGASDFRRRIEKPSYSDQYLSTMGLKFLSCGIPKKSRSHRRKENTAKKAEDAERRKLLKTVEIPVPHGKNRNESYTDHRIDNADYTRSRRPSGNARNFRYGYSPKESESRECIEMKEDFDTWCDKRKAMFSSTKNNKVTSEVSHNLLVQSQQQLILPEKRSNDFSYHISRSPTVKQSLGVRDKRTYHSSSSSSDSSQIPRHNPKVMIPEKRSPLKTAISHSGHEKRPSKDEFENASKLDESENTMLCINVNIRGEKSSESVTDLRTFLRVKNKFPKFGKVIPDVDANENQLQYSADAVKTVIGFLFNPSCNFNSIRNEITAVEVLALTYAWDITKFQKLYQKHLLGNILSEKNAAKIYSLATHFKLHEVQEACLLLKNNIETVTYKQRKCSVAVCTYVDPLEFPILLQPAEKQLSESFDRSIQNEIEFESFSEYYTITGFQIQLNIDDSAMNSNSKLTVFYSCENTTEKLVMPEQKIHKLLGSTIILYFNKKLLIKPKQKGKLSIYTELKPCVCYTYENGVIENDKFRLTLTSNYKVQKTDKRVFFIGKLFYHVKCPAA